MAGEPGKNQKPSLGKVGKAFKPSFLMAISRRIFSRSVRNFSSGFTLTELLIVIAIITLLVSLLLPSLFKARLLAKRVASAANLKAIGQAAALYQSDFGEFVPICWRNHESSYKSWRMSLLPYTSGVATFNCPAAKDMGVLGEVIHSVEELASTKREDQCYTANAGSYGVILQYTLPYDNIDYAGRHISQGHPISSQAFPTTPGVAWRDPNNSIYVADACLTKSPVDCRESYKHHGTSAIDRPDTEDYKKEDEVARRFADRHLGTNCLFLDWRVEVFVTEDLEAMIEGEKDCVWDVE